MSTVLNKLIDIASSLNSRVDAFLSGTQKTDVWFIVGFLVASLLATLIFKRRKIIVFSLAIYVVIALYQALPFDLGLKIGGNIWIFLGTVLAMYWILVSSIAKNFYSGTMGDYTGRFKTFLLAIITLGFLVSSAFNFVINIDILTKIELVNKIFSGDLSRTIWALLPLAGFLFLK